MSATITRTTAAPQPAGSAKKPKGTPALNTASKTKEVDDLLAGMSMATSQIGNLTLAAASEKDAKQRAERDLEVERSKVQAHERKDKTPRPTAAGAAGRSAREKQVLDELAQLRIDFDGTESNLRKSKEQLAKELDVMRIRAEAADAAGKKLEGELATARASGEASEMGRRKLEGELASARGEVSKLTAKVKEDYAAHVKSEEEHFRKEDELEDELVRKEELLEKVLSGLRYYRARLEAYGKM